MVLTQTMKIIDHARFRQALRLRASPRHGRVGVFRYIDTDPPRGRPFGGGAGHRNSGIGTSRNYWNCAIFHGKSSKYFS